MKKILYIACLMFTFCTFAQAPAMQWQKTYGGSSNDFGDKILPTPDGGYIVAGHTVSSDGDVINYHGSFDIWVFKINADGAIEWKNTYGGSGWDRVNAMFATADGGYVLGGETHSTDGDVTGNHGISDYWLVKISNTGALLWQKTFGGSSGETMRDAIPTADGGYALIGYAYSTDGDVSGVHGSTDIWIVKLDADRNLEWQKNFGGTGSDDGLAIIQTLDGGYLAAGGTLSTDIDSVGNHGNADSLVLKLDSTGGMQWSRILGGSLGDVINEILQETDGNYLLAGYSNSIDGDLTQNSGLYSGWIVKLDGEGNLLWQKSIASGGNDRFSSMRKTADGNYIFAGAAPTSNGTDNLWVVKTDLEGNVLWEKSLGSTQSDVALDIRQTVDNSYIVTGFVTGGDGDVIASHPLYECWVVKLAPENLSSVEFIGDAGIISPNPAISLLQFQLPDSMQLDRISITDISGKTLLRQTGNQSINR